MYLVLTECFWSGSLNVVVYMIQVYCVFLSVHCIRRNKQGKWRLRDLKFECTDEATRQSWVDKIQDGICKQGTQTSLIVPFVILTIKVCNASSCLIELDFKCGVRTKVLPARPVLHVLFQQRQEHRHRSSRQTQ